MQSGTAPAAALPTADDSDLDTIPSSESHASAPRKGGSPAEPPAAAPLAAAIVPSPSSAHSHALQTTQSSDALARLDEYDALAQRVLGDAVLDTATAVHRLASHIAAMAERIENLDKAGGNCTTSHAAESDSILASAERELQMMEDLIRQQDEYIAQLEKGPE